MMKKIKTKKVWCKRCFGTGYCSNAYSRPRCEVCKGNGYIWREVRKYVKKKDKKL